MKILAIGTGYSQFVKEPIEYTLLDGDNEIYVTYNEDESSNFRDFYKENGIKLLNLHDKKKILSRIPKLGTVYNLYVAVKAISKAKPFDVIHIHSMNSYVYTYFIIYGIRKYSKRIICTIYGSDILLKTDRELMKFKKIFDKIDSISMASNSLIDKFRGAYGSKYDDKICKLPFGLSNLNYIDESTQRDVRKNILHNQDRTVISIGHNNCIEQQHLKAIEAVGLLPEDVREKIVIILQLTYGNGDKDYIAEVKSSANKLGCEIIVLEDYMNGAEIADMVNAVDIYINSQKSDALSGAMIEYLYANTIVLNPKWLDYNELKEKGCEFIQYGAFEEIPEIIASIIEGKKKINFNKNQSIIAELFHWKKQKDKWRRFIGCDN